MISIILAALVGFCIGGIVESKILRRRMMEELEENDSVIELFHKTEAPSNPATVADEFDLDKIDLQ